jgi:hypothetical protein
MDFSEQSHIKGEVKSTAQLHATDCFTFILQYEFCSLLKTRNTNIELVRKDMDVNPWFWFGFMVFNATFNNISVFLVEETRRKPLTTRHVL